MKTESSPRMSSKLAILVYLVTLSLWQILSAHQTRVFADLSPIEASETFSLQQLVELSLRSHPGVEARRFEILAAERGLGAAQSLFGLQLSGDLDLMDDLVTIPNPLEMGARTPIETQRYSAELRLSQPLRWGTVLGFGLRQSQIETTNPFRNCVPGIISDRCFESTLTLTLNQPLIRGRSVEVNTSEERGATFALEGAKAQLSVEVIDQVRRIASLGLQLSLAHRQHHLEEEQLALTKRRLVESRERLKLGLIAESDLYPLEAAIAQQAQAVMSSLGRVEDYQAQLSTLSGQQVTEVSFPSNWLKADRLQGSIRALNTFDPSSHPRAQQLMAMTKQLKVQREPLRDAQRSQLNLGLVWSQSGLGEALNDALGALPDNESRFYGVTLRYTQALSDRAKLQSAQLEAQLRSRAAEREALSRELKLQWGRAVSSLHRNHELLKLAELAQQATVRNHEATSAKFDEGRATIFEVLELQNQRLATQTRALSIEHEIAQSLIELWALNGELLDRFDLRIR